MATSGELITKILSDAGSDLSRKLSGSVTNRTALLDEHLGKLEASLEKASSDLAGSRATALAFASVLCALNLRLHEELKNRLKTDGAPLPQSVAYRLVDLWGNVVGTRSLVRDLAIMRSGESIEAKARESIATHLAEENLRALLLELSRLGCLTDYAELSDWAAAAREARSLASRSEVGSYITHMAA